MVGVTFLSLARLSEAKKNFVCFSADFFWVAQVDGLTRMMERLFRGANKKDPKRRATDF
jgi:hypothetical protein